MRQGKQSLMDLAAEVERQTDMKRDLLAPTERLGMIGPNPAAPREFSEPNEHMLTVTNGNGPESFPMTRLAHTQLAAHLNIPQDYYDRTMREHPALLTESVNAWMRSHQGETRLVRTLDGKARAFLSNSYRRVDNYDVLKAVLPMLKDQNLRPVSLEVTESRLYVKVVSMDLVARPVVGDDLRMGAVISNSEVGLGSISVRAFTERLVCMNGMIRESVLRAAHLGRKQVAGESFELDMTSDRTNLLDDAALMSRLRDAVAYVLSPAHVTRREDEARRAAGMALPAAQVPQVIEVIGKRLQLTGEERTSVMGSLIEAGDLSAWGMANAITALSDKAASYDRASDLEAAGGTVLDLGQGEWSAVLAEAEKLTRSGQ